ncbi:hypothetical protein BDN72DRAFT_965291 [Pluteus cervinus]|uniref:Uncharacterized protein n=1 Tax=Pluteus cervinus TaxID=181527 RepID=A0ACD3A6L2_9AGAR|nr:hypothetical protein BDN72DRAFT_965291 [Pluteus cervinus]
MRRSFLALAAFLGGLQPSLALPPLSITLPANAYPVTVIDDNFMGVSWELSSFNTLWGDNADSSPPAMQNYLHNFAARLSKPLRIRVGGNGMDSSTYDPSLGTFLTVDPSTDVNNDDISVHFGPIVLDVMNAMSDKVGEMQFLFGLPLRSPEADNYVPLTNDTAHKLGSRLDALLLGNEPDLYVSHGDKAVYGIPDYITDVDSAFDKIRAIGVNPDNLLAGPTICCSWNLSTLFDAGFNKLDWKYYTVQRYPQNVCSGVNDANTDISYFVQHSNVGPFLSWQSDGFPTAIQEGKPVVLSEYNSVACGGSNISDTFAMSMWGVDVALKAASMNYSSVFLHTRERNVTYNLFDPPVSQNSSEPDWHTGSTYYAVLFMSEVLLADGSMVTDLNIDNSMFSPNATSAAYAIFDKTGTSVKRLVFMNFADGQSQDYVLPSGSGDQVGYRLLTAPSLVERQNISWAGQTIGLNGELDGQQTTTNVSCKDGCTITIPGPGLALVSLDGGGSFYTGNSTSAGVDGHSVSTSKSNALRVGLGKEIVAAAVVLASAFVGLF